jgi:phosphoglycerate dehydrogenase-like enzyme
MKIVLCSRSTAVGLDYLRPLELGELVAVEPADGERLRTALRDSQVLVCNEVSPADTADADSLQLIQLLSTGVDDFDWSALPSGCTLCNVHDHEIAIGEWALMSMLALTRRLLVSDRDLRRGEWRDFDALPEERDLFGRTLGVVGLGSIGTRVVELARAVGMRAIGVTRAPTRDRARRHGLDWLGAMDELDRLFAEADFAVLCLPLTAETEGLVKRDQLSLLGPHGYLLNPSRAAIVDERDLYDALLEGCIGGAAIDTWYRYPARSGERALPATSPFWELENMVMTPHSASWTTSTVERRWSFVRDQLLRLREGAPMLNVVGGHQTA